MPRYALMISALLALAPVASAQEARGPQDHRAVLHRPDDPFWSQKAPDVFRAHFTTTKGSFVIEAHREWSPHGVDRFYNLVRSGYYDDSRFTRVVPDWIVQFGIAGDPKVARVWYTRTFLDDSVRQSNVRSFVAFAMTGPNKRTTQLFINKGDNSRQDSQGFSPIGRVVEGMAVVDSIYDGYGENSGGGVRRGLQGPLVEGGNAYVDANYPKLDRLVKARIE